MIKTSLIYQLRKQVQKINDIHFGAALMNTIAEQPSVKSRGQLKLWGLILIAATPIVAAAIMYFGQIGLPDSTTNHGHLILPPLQGEDWGLAEVIKTDGFIQYDGKAKWVMLVVGDGGCTELCLQQLYLTRQLNIALGKEVDRVTRLLWVDAQTQGLDAALKEHELLQVEPFDNTGFKGLAEALKRHGVELSPYDILLMDPLGNIMMHYNQNNNGKDILDDLKRLLKVSKIG